MSTHNAPPQALNHPIGTSKGDRAVSQLHADCVMIKTTHHAFSPTLAYFNKVVA